MGKDTGWDTVVCHKSKSYTVCGHGCVLQFTQACGFVTWPCEVLHGLIKVTRPCDPCTQFLLKIFNFFDLVQTQCKFFQNIFNSHMGLICIILISTWLPIIMLLIFNLLLEFVWTAFATSHYSLLKWLRFMGLTITHLYTFIVHIILSSRYSWARSSQYTNHHSQFGISRKQ